MNKIRLKYEPNRDLGEASKDYAERIFHIIRRKFPNAKHILDIGMGKGYLVKKLRDNRLIAFGSDLRELGQENLIISDAKDLPFKSEVFDVVVECYLLEDVRDFQKYTNHHVQKIIKESTRVLKKGGAFITVPSTKPSKQFFTRLYDDGCWGLYLK